MSVVKTYNSQLTIFLKPTHSITISSVGLILLICIRLFTIITCTLKRNKSPKGQCNHLSPTHLSIEIGPTDLPTFSLNWTPRLKRNCISKISDFQNVRQTRKTSFMISTWKGSWNGAALRRLTMVRLNMIVFIFHG